MNIAITGCGNVGFETAKRLSRDHHLLLINRRLPADVAQFVRGHRNVSFTQADATDPLGVEQALAGFGAPVDRVDVLVSTVGAFCSTSAREDSETFAPDFHLNFCGNVVPIQAVVKRMMAARAGRIAVLSSTSGAALSLCLGAMAPQWHERLLSRV